MQMRKALTTLALVALTANVAACADEDEPTASASGGASAATGAVSEEVVQRVEELRQRPDKIKVTAPIEGEVPSGKRLVYLACGVPACEVFGDPLKEAASALGWTVDVIDYGLTPESVKAGWAEALRKKPDAVVETGGFPTDFYKAEFEQAKAAKLPIVSISEPGPVDGIIDIDGKARYELLGGAMADWVTADSGGDAKIFYINTSTFPVLNLGLSAFKTQLGKVCPGCKVEEFDAPATSIGNDLAQRASQAMTRFQDTDYVIAGYNDMTLGLPAALKAAGFDVPGKTKIITQGMGTAVLPQIESGEVDAMYTLPVGEISWQAVDLVLRSFTGQDLSANKGTDSYTEWFVTKDTLPGSKAIFDNVEGYKDQYKELWGK